jgi:queuosine precursor transporter
VRKIGIAAAVGFVATVWAANWAVKEYGPVSVGFGLVAPAGVYFAGLAFTLRDIVHRTLGRAVVVFAILVGSALAYFVEANVDIPGGVTSLAVASAIAFLVSELCDLVVYEPIRNRGWLPAVVASNAVGIVVDSALFLWLAFGSLEFFKGQVVGKAWMTLAAVLFLLALNLATRRRGVVPA